MTANTDFYDILMLKFLQICFDVDRTFKKTF